jgi:hypothetical protein
MELNNCEEIVLIEIKEKIINNCSLNITKSQKK